MNNLLEILDKEGVEEIYIVTHVNGDPDALSSAYLLTKFLKVNGYRKTYLVVPKGPSSKTIEILRRLRFRISYLTNLMPNGEKFYIVVDTANPEMLDDIGKIIYRAQRNRVIWIDHHKTMHKFVESLPYKYIDDKASSTLEILLDIIAGYMPIENLLIDDKETIFLLLSLYIETKWLTIATDVALYWFSNLLNYLNIKIGDLLKYIPRQEVIETSQKIGIIKSFKRASWFKLGDTYISITHISGYHNIVSSQHIRIGVDLSIVYSYKKKVKIHIRASNKKNAQKIMKRFIELILSRFGDMEISHGGHQTIYNIEITNKLSKTMLNEVIIDALSKISTEEGLTLEEI